MSAPYLILGSGYTGHRVAQSLRALGRTVLEFRTQTHNGSLPFDILNPATHHHLTQALAPGARVLYSLPVLRTPNGYQPTAPTAAPLLASSARVVYLSTTGVYGDVHHVNETMFCRNCGAATVTALNTRTTSPLRISVAAA
ncbi:MAG: hypothetical protein J0L64_20780, partial [Acidobacteria bacterium]|nr:hypothetical protein [Acidobacteriota bacterium]